MVALVTGGGRGIGRGIALRLAEEGWEVAVTARSADELGETVALSRGRMVGAPADVSDPSSVAGLVRRAEAALGAIDLLVNNAAIPGPIGPFLDNDPEAWWRCQEVNLRGPMLCSRAVLPGMIARRGGRIVNVVSGAGCQAFPDLSAYVISKTALVRLSEQLALEMQPHGVAVFALRPGIVRTAMVEEARHKLAYIQQMLDDGREVTPDVVAGFVLLLASGRADALSGMVFSVDDDVEEMIRHAGELRSRERYLLRLRTSDN
jgi:NAD(P)-dependent dehydrogenase (short-subunit alcohol dehydrogenase family)